MVKRVDKIMLKIPPTKKIWVLFVKISENKWSLENHRKQKIILRSEQSIKRPHSDGKKN